MRFKLSKLTIATLLGCMSFSQFAYAGAAPTTSVTIGSTVYNLTTAYISYTGSPSLFTTGNMPWWGNYPLAAQITKAVGTGLGYFLPGTSSTVHTALAAYGTSSGHVSVTTLSNGLFSDFPSGPSESSLYNYIILAGYGASISATEAVTSVGNSPAYGAAHVINANPSMFAMFTLAGLTGNQQISNGVSQTLPMLTGGGTLVTGNVLRDINSIIQARTESNLGLSSGDAFLGEKHVWLKPFGSWFDQSNKDSVTGYAGRVDGLAAGVDGAISRASRMGVALAYAQANLDGNSSSAPQSLKIDFYQLIGYGSYSLDPLNEINYQVDLGDNRNSGQRGILFMGQTASSSYDTFTAHAGVGIGHIMPLSSATTFVPSARVDYTSIHDQSYSETGAGVFNLSVGAHTTQQLILSADGKLVHNLDNSTKFIINAGVGYDTLAKRASVTATFAGAPGMAFDTVGLSPSPWLLHGGIGFVKTVANGMEITARYDVEGQTGFINQTVSAKLRWAF